MTDDEIKHEIRTIKRIVSGARQLADLAESIGYKDDARQLRIFAQRREPLVKEGEDKKQSAEIFIFKKK